MPFLYHFDIAADIESISTWCSSAIWEKFYDMASYFDTNTEWDYKAGGYHAKYLYFCYFDVCHEFPISTEELHCKPVLIFSQILWILSIRLIERETDMRIYCSQWQLDDELYNSREEKLIEPWDTAS